MKLSKGKISKLYHKKNQSRRRIKKRKRGTNNNKTFRQRRDVNLTNKTLKNYQKGGDGSAIATSAALTVPVPLADVKQPTVKNSWLGFGKKQPMDATTTLAVPLADVKQTPANPKAKTSRFGFGFGKKKPMDATTATGETATGETAATSETVVPVASEPASTTETPTVPFTRPPLRHMDTQKDLTDYILISDSDEAKQKIRDLGGNVSESVSSKSCRPLLSFVNLKRLAPNPIKSCLSKSYLDQPSL